MLDRWQVKLISLTDSQSISSERIVSSTVLPRDKLVSAKTIHALEAAVFDVCLSET